MQYRCYFLNLRSAVEAVEIIEADTDAEALNRAETLFREQGSGFSDFDVWDRGRRVERELNGKAEELHEQSHLA